MERQVFYIFGMKRSGNHVIINWLINHYNKEEVLFFNNLKLHRNIPQFRINKKKHIISHSKYLFFSFEDYGLKSCGKKYIKNEKQIFGDIDKKFNILIMRDPFNLFASRLKHNSMRREYQNKHLNRWKQYAYEYLGKTQYIKNKIFILFNKWHKRYEYRRYLENKLGVDKTDEGFDYVPAKGHASSFDKTKYQDDGSKMDVLNRWKSMKKNKLFKNILKDEELKMLSSDIFDFSIG